MRHPPIHRVYCRDGKIAELGLVIGSFMIALRRWKNFRAHYKTNSRIIRRIIRFGLVLELSGLVVRTIWLIVRIISSP